MRWGFIQWWSGGKAWRNCGKVKRSIDRSGNCGICCVINIFGNSEVDSGLPINMEVKSEIDPEKMLRVNGGAVLLSYFRPIIAALTMQAGIRPLNNKNWCGIWIKIRHRSFWEAVPFSA